MFTKKPIVRKEPEGTIIGKERDALKRWTQGDPNGLIDLMAEDVTYIDPSLESRIFGKNQFIDHVAPLRGTFIIPKFQMVTPKVQLCGNNEVAVLTFSFLELNEDEQITSQWNCTEVLVKRYDDWKIISSHWSQPVLEEEEVEEVKVEKTETVKKEVAKKEVKKEEEEEEKEPEKKKTRTKTKK